MYGSGPRTVLEVILEVLTNSFPVRLRTEEGMVEENQVAEITEDSKLLVHHSSQAKKLVTGYHFNMLF